MALPQPHAEAVVTEAGLAALLLASLAAFGISVTALAGAEEVGPWIVQQFQEYVESVGDNLSSVWSRIRYGLSEFGELILNAFALRYNARFGEWLVNKFSVSNDVSISIPSSQALSFLKSTSSVPSASTLASSGSYLWSFRDSSRNVIYRNYALVNNPFVFCIAYPNSDHPELLGGRIYVSTVPSSVVYSVISGLDSSITTRYVDTLSEDGTYYYNHLPYGSGSSMPGLFPDASSICYLSPSRDDAFSVIPDLLSSFIVLSSGSLSVPDTSSYDLDDAIVISGLVAAGSSLEDLSDAIDGLTLPGSSSVINNYITYSIVPESDVADYFPSDTVVIDPVSLPLPVVVQGEVLTVLGGGSVTIINGAQDAIPVYLPGGITVTWPVDGIPIEWPTNGIPVTWPSGGIPIDWPSGGIPVTWPSGGIPIQWPSGGIPLDVPAGGIPVSLPSGGIPVTWPSGGIPIDWPSSGIPVDLPAGGIPVDWPVDGIPVTWPSDGIPIDWDDAPTLSVELPDTLVGDFIDEGILTTENSPGYFNGLPLISGIPDFGFGDLWHYVSDWVNSMSAGLSLISGIMFSLPFVSAFYAFVVILIVLSLWRLLRSA